MVNGNTAKNGGAVLNVDEALTLNGVIIANCQAGGDGGAISVASGAGSLTLLACTIRDNAATGDYSHGGGINLDASSDVIIERSTISGNQSGEDGGGIY